MKQNHWIKKYPELISLQGEIGMSSAHYVDGKFDYKKYKKDQIALNKKKINFLGPNYSRMEPVASYIKENVKNITFGLCHGTRRGDEQKNLAKALGIKVLGTEISPTATDFKDTIEWDFHEVKEEWIGKVSFIYSNSLDHSYDPIKCLGSWMSCVSPGGVILIQRASDDLPGMVKENSTDIFQASPKAFEKIVDIAGESMWKVLYPNSLKISKTKRVVVLARKEN
tara:strand:+ start:1818 stop:2492 length:675 start_codon:yes stop_codon:yes gene_type:complete